ncbi:MAG: UDP-glucose dehydrogenase family protein [Bacteroidales bacterium]
MKIVIIGTGYVGLVTGACFSEMGAKVVCMDINSEKIESLKKGNIPIYEPGLEELVKKNIKDNRLSFTTHLSSALTNASLVFCTVGTPQDKDGNADLTYVKSTAEAVGQNMKDYLVFITKSTVPIGTSKLVKEIIQQELDKRGAHIPFDVASNPEFLKEGDAIKDFLTPERVVIGTDSPKAQKLLSKLYKPFVMNGYPIIFMDIASAEMTKYAANAMLATRISFMNDIANLCEIVGADVDLVRKGIGTDSRIGKSFLYPGCGYGGSCFPKDVKALISVANNNNYNLRILKATEEINKDQKHVLIHKLKHHIGDVKGKTIAIWGLAFKPETDDMREASSIVIIDEILKQGGIVKAYDPVAMPEARKIWNSKINTCEDMYDVTSDADALLIVTEWKQFRLPNWKLVSEKMNGNLVIDGRNIYDESDINKEGLKYYRIGKRSEV